MMVDKKAGPVFNSSNDPCAHLLRYGRAPKCGSHHSIFVQYPEAHVGSAVYHNIPIIGIIIESFIYPIDPQRKTIAAIISAACYVKPQAALARFVLVRKRMSVFFS